ncbi:MAG: DUF2070 family protein [Thaumarchaeota archaeon]|nr:DUF2070 family protein [Nitrososphaerota archaeon]
MSSTSSSAETDSLKSSATKDLASRYRHLFVLPSTQMILSYAAVTSFLLIIASRGVSGALGFVPTFVAFALSTSAVFSALLLVDPDTLANFRRTSAVLLAGNAIWIVCAGAGALFSRLSGSASAMTNSLVFGAFLCGGFEFLLINGAFTENSLLSLAAASLHPASTLLMIRLPELEAQFDPYPFLLGSIAFVAVGCFIFFLRRKKTSRGFNALRLFQAFMKTWAGGSPSDLESIIAEHSETVELTTKVLRFQAGGGDTYVVLPSVHPGPFHGVGSYNLPGAVGKAFSGLGPVLTLHRPGGHERNLATAEETKEYAKLLSEFAGQVEVSKERSIIKGPVRTSIGKAVVTATAFSNDLLVAITFSPRGSDDIEDAVESELGGIARESGFDASVVDAHNSLGTEQLSPDTTDPSWPELFQRVAAAKPGHFRTAYAHSNEVNFAHSGDITENGIDLMMFESDGVKNVLVLADANNAVSALRSQVASSLEQAGYYLMEVCTSDSHDLAARGLTVSRGYEALGEATAPDSIAKALLEMAKLAEGRLSACRYGSGSVTHKLRVFGSKALEEFAGITKTSSRLGRIYLRLTVVSIALLLLLSVSL